MTNRLLIAKNRFLAEYYQTDFTGFFSKLGQKTILKCSISTLYAAKPLGLAMMISKIVFD